MANITPRGLTVTANDAAKALGETMTFAGTEFTASGLQNGETVGTVTLSSLGAMVTAGTIVLDSFDAIALPDDARPVFGASSIVTSRVTGVVHADPRFETVFVCFGGGYGIAPSCFPAHQ